jgi:hypothetical protein
MAILEEQAWGVPLFSRDFPDGSSGNDRERVSDPVTGYQLQKMAHLTRKFAPTRLG